jgi:hypothetical protein
MLCLTSPHRQRNAFVFRAGGLNLEPEGVASPFAVTSPSSSILPQNKMAAGASRAPRYSSNVVMDTSMDPGKLKRTPSASAQHWRKRQTRAGTATLFLHTSAEQNGGRSVESAKVLFQSDLTVQVFRLCFYGPGQVEEDTFSVGAALEEAANSSGNGDTAGKPAPSDCHVW